MKPHLAPESLTDGLDGMEQSAPDSEIQAAQVALGLLVTPDDSPQEPSWPGGVPSDREGLPTLSKRLPRADCLALAPGYVMLNERSQWLCLRALESLRDTMQERDLAPSRELLQLLASFTDALAGKVPPASMSGCFPGYSQIRRG